MAKEFFDISIFTDPKSAIGLLGNAVRKGIEYNSLAPDRTFQAVVLTYPYDITSAEALGITPSSGKTKAEGVQGDDFKKFVFKGRILGPNSPHNFLPDPCSLDISTSPECSSQVIAMHTTFISNDDIREPNAARPNIGDIVNVKLEQNVFAYDLQYGEYINLSQKNAIDVQTGTNACEIIADIYDNMEDWDSTNIGRGASFSIIDVMYKQAPVVGADQMVEGEGFSNLTAIVEAELKLWDGKIETDTEMYEQLKVYWSAISWYEAETGQEPSWTPAGVPWSAAFISYVMARVDPSFPRVASHYSYADAAAKGVGGWTLWALSPGINGEIKAQVGDILVRSRAGSTGYESHGDVVYKIENNIASLAGGNVGDTAKTVKELSLTESGLYSSEDIGSYKIILKKNGKAITLAIT